MSFSKDMKMSFNFKDHKLWLGAFNYNKRCVEYNYTKYIIKKSLHYILNDV